MRRLTDDELAAFQQADPYHRLVKRFFDDLRDLPAGRALEIGSRNRSGITRRELVPSEWEYVGFDIVQGENVDVVGDAHALSTVFGRDEFNAVFAVSVFEHLLMPWKAAIEINRVMATGGVLFVSSHQAWPVHEYPWDYWRFSDQAWHGLFNAYTGFEIVDAVMGEPGYITPDVVHGPTDGLDQQPAWLATAVIARKIGDTELSWDVPHDGIVGTQYPH